MSGVDCLFVLFEGLVNGLCLLLDFRVDLFVVGGDFLGSDNLVDYKLAHNSRLSLLLELRAELLHGKLHIFKIFFELYALIHQAVAEILNHTVDFVFEHGVGNFRLRVLADFGKYAVLVIVAGFVYGCLFKTLARFLL